MIRAKSSSFILNRLCMDLILMLTAVQKEEGKIATSCVSLKSLNYSFVFWIHFFIFKYTKFNYKTR
jgi:hypothetical protein